MAGASPESGNLQACEWFVRLTTTTKVGDDSMEIYLLTANWGHREMTVQIASRRDIEEGNGSGSFVGALWCPKDANPTYEALYALAFADIPLPEKSLVSNELFLSMQYKRNDVKASPFHMGQFLPFRVSDVPLPQMPPMGPELPHPLHVPPPSMAPMFAKRPVPEPQNASEAEPLYPSAEPAPAEGKEVALSKETSSWWSWLWNSDSSSATVPPPPAETPKPTPPPPPSALSQMSPEARDYHTKLAQQEMPTSVPNSVSIDQVRETSTRNWRTGRLWWRKTHTETTQHGTNTKIDIAKSDSVANVRFSHVL